MAQSPATVAVEPNFEVSTAYEWVRQGRGTGKNLIRIRMTLRNLQPGFQEVVSILRSEVYANDRDWATGVAWADEVEAEEYLAANHPYA